MGDWSVTVEFQEEASLTVDQVDGLLGALNAHAGVLTAAQPGHGTPGRWSATVSVDDDTVDAAVKSALAIVRKSVRKIGVAGDNVLALEAVEGAERDRRLEEPSFPELVGVAEISEILGVSRQRASYVAGGKTFPAPLAVLRSGPIWIRANVESFLEAWTRKVGRPATASGGSVSAGSAGSSPAKAAGGSVTRGRAKSAAGKALTRSHR